MENNEVIMAALLANGSVRAAARSANVSEATIRARLKNKDFRERYESEKAKILSEACDALTARLTLAIDTLCEVLEDVQSPATVKVSASDCLLRHCVRYVEIVSILSRIEALETMHNTTN